MGKKIKFFQKKLKQLVTITFFCCVCVSLSGQCDGWTWSGATFSDSVFDLVVDDAGAVYSVGRVNRSSNIEGTEIEVGEDLMGLYLTKNDAEGAIAWTKTVTGKIYIVRPNLTTFGERIYLSFTFLESIEWDGVTYTGPQDFSATLLVAMDLEGNTEWVEQIDGPSGTTLHHTGGMTTDAEGNLYMTGRIGGEMSLFGTDLSLEGNGTSGVYVAKITPDGELVWAKNSINSGPARGWAIDVDTENNVIVGGYTVGSIQFDDNNFDVGEAAAQSGLLAKFDSDGNNLWVTGFPATQFSPIYGLKTDEDNNIYVTGILADGTMVLGSPFDANGSKDAYVAKFLPFGVVDWVQSFGGFETGGDEWATSINFNNEGNLLVTGQILDEAIFDEGAAVFSLGANGSLRTMIAEFTKTGEFIDVVGTGGSSWQYSYQSVYKDDFLYMNGYFLNNAILGGDTLIADSENPDSAFIAAFIWKLDLSDGLQAVTSEFTEEVLFANTYEFTNTGSDNYTELTWTTDSGDQFSNVDPLVYAFEDTIGFVCLTVNNCMSRQTFCKEFDNISEGIDVLTIAEATLTDASGLSEVSGTVCELRGVVYGPNFSTDGLTFTLIDPTGGIEVYGIDLPFEYNPTEGDSLHVTGILDQRDGMSQIFPDNILVISSGNAINDPVTVESLGESTESELISLNCLTLNDVSEWDNSTGSFMVEASNGTDNFSILIHENTDFFSENAPTETFNLTGIGIQNTGDNDLLNNYLVRPRSLNDLENVTAVEVDFTIENETENYTFTVDELSETATYFWTVNNEPIGQGDSADYTTVEGFTICLNALNECEAGFNSCQEVVGVGINVLDAALFVTISPNPIRETGIIELNNINETIEDFTIYTTQGNALKATYSVQGNKVVLDVNALAAGLYQFQLKNDQSQVYVGKIVVVK